jgi:Gp49-like protein DUF891
MPAREFYASLGPKDEAKVQALFGRLASKGQITNREKFKRVEGTDLFELKSHQLRFLGGFRPGGRFLIAHGLWKKKDRLSHSDIEIASRVLTQHDTREKTLSSEGTKR